MKDALSFFSAPTFRLLCGLAGLIVPLAAAAEPAGEVALRCRWPAPAGESLELVFSANPLILVQAGAEFEISAVSADFPETDLIVMRDGLPLRRERTLFFTAPEQPGAYYLGLAAAAPGGNREKTLCVVIAHRAEEKRTGEGSELFVDGERIGRYRHPSRSGNLKVKKHPESYRPPVWWLKLTPGNSTFEVVPGLAAGDLVSPPEDGGPRHTDLAPVCYPMWLAIRSLREALPALGLPAESLRIISMFRSPAHNRGIGSNSFSRHLYGDAFDFYIGLDGSGKAADLNHDGRLDHRDAYPLIGLMEDLQAEGKIPLGGLGVYNTVGGDHEVTLHLDLRGHRATWGYIYGASGKRSEFAWASRRFADLDRRDEQEAAGQAARENRKYLPPRREPLP
ncbi:MAG: hypothetical protein LBU23_08245 [Planctomycetota bacterium]|jgi:hypothetical protein|nr:hypothetical protein [Planctomycetota bacterium]MDR1520114.1 hypothetical protein [Planctomycetota bacterium]